MHVNLMSNACFSVVLLCSQPKIILIIVILLSHEYVQVLN